MFTIPRVNVIESDEGFSVEVLGQTGVQYAESGKNLFIDSEVLAGPAGMIIYSNSIKNWEDGSTVDEVEQTRIVDNVKRAFRHRGLEIQVA